ncbi:hypothetical protein BVRB_037280, partial [Beta vulgaris subsp. vulgaris]
GEGINSGKLWQRSNDGLQSSHKTNERESDAEERR